MRGVERSRGAVVYYIFHSFIDSSSSPFQIIVSRFINTKELNRFPLRFNVRRNEFEWSVETAAVLRKCRSNCAIDICWRYFISTALPVTITQQQSRTVQYRITETVRRGMYWIEYSQQHSMRNKKEKKKSSLRCGTDVLLSTGLFCIGHLYIWLLLLGVRCA